MHGQNISFLSSLLLIHFVNNTFMCAVRNSRQVDGKIARIVWKICELKFSEKRVLRTIWATVYPFNLLVILLEKSQF
jgi:hypothetical protein